jgi:ABC-2 type transport system permease protein
MEYRADFLLGMISATFPIIIQVFMWSAIYGGNEGAIYYNRSYGQMIAYTVMASILNRVIRTGFEYEVNNDIKNGDLSKYIVRPLHYLPYRLSCFMGQKTGHLTASLGLLALALVILTLLFGGGVVGVSGVLTFIPALALAFLLNFMIFFCVAMWAFWMNEIGFFFEAVRIVFIVLSGGIFPLDIFGEGMGSVLKLLPFSYTINFPVDVLSGVTSGMQIVAGFGMQLFWIAVLYGLSSFLWRIGSRKYVAAGG